jgi:hypothetical protein
MRWLKKELCTNSINRRPELNLNILLAIQTTALLAALIRPNHIVIYAHGALSFAASL